MKKISHAIAGLLSCAMFFTFTACNALGVNNVEQGPQGVAGTNGQDGKDGKDGADGLTPYIGDNGNWWIGTTDTGIKAMGKDGVDGTNGTNGKDGVDGKDGKDGADGKNGTDGANGMNGTDGVGIAKAEIIDGCLWITYTDDLENPVNIGKLVEEKEEIYTDGLDFYPLPDGTYGVSAGKTKYLPKSLFLLHTTKSPSARF